LWRLAPLLLVDAGVNGNVRHVTGMDEFQPPSPEGWGARLVLTIRNSAL
jgi:hypothetical protein